MEFSAEMEVAPPYKMLTLFRPPKMLALLSPLPLLTLLTLLTQRHKCLHILLDGLRASKI